MFDLRAATPREWLDVVFADFDAFLLDHALCERKASALGMSLVAKYPDRSAILEPLIEFAREELEHFHVMFKVIAARGLQLPEDAKDPYVNELRRLATGKGPELLLDRLITAGVIEARGCERLMMVARALSEEPLKRTYLELARAESRHHGLFFRLARHYFSDATIADRAAYFLDAEAKIMLRQPLRAAVH